MFFSRHGDLKGGLRGRRDKAQNFSRILKKLLDKSLIPKYNGKVDGLRGPAPKPAADVPCKLNNET